MDFLSLVSRKEGGRNRGGRQIEEESSKDPNAPGPPGILACLMFGHYIYAVGKHRTLLTNLHQLFETF